MAKAKDAPLPKKVIIRDEFGGRWEVDEKDDFWEAALTFTNNGKAKATVPLAVITANLGWGWWTVFKNQEDWYKAIGIPKPEHNLLDGLATAGAAQLSERLQEFGGYVAYLEAQLWALAGKRDALKSAYDAAVAIHTASIEEKASEKAKEAQVLSESETLRQTKRLYIEIDALYSTAKGMCEAYKKAWETVSRIVTIKLGEMETTAGSRR